MKTLQEIRDLAKAYAACESQYKPFVAALEAGDKLLAWQIVLGDIDWLEEEDIGLDIKEVCKLADNIGLKYYENGAIMWRDIYKDGKRHGLCEEYYESGAIMYRTTFKDGELLEEKHFEDKK
ncbi:MAG: hypothetical protein NT007_09825 [Candidatus Kapabacteria bacterium]|nr:hypothetical protein [Candidatus Kapabacteria bacterium]